MTRRLNVLILAAVVLAASGLSCLDPDKEPKPPVQAPPTYQNLTQKDHVLNNLELAYNGRNYARYAELLDEGHFTYYFSTNDIDTPAQWGRQEDLDSHEKMFDPNNQDHRVLSIKLNLQYSVEQWIETTPDQQQHPGETWYFKSVSYDLTVLVEAQPENITYLAQNLKALFTVRQIEKDGKMIWQIVEWYDDVQI